MCIFKKSYKNVPSESWDEFAKELNEDGLINLTIPIYEKHYTHNDVKGLIKFYYTPVGKKTIEILHLLTKNSVEARQKWGRQIGEREMEMLKQKGYFK